MAVAARETSAADDKELFHSLGASIGRSWRRLPCGGSAGAESWGLRCRIADSHSFPAVWRTPSAIGSVLDTLRSAVDRPGSLASRFADKTAAAVAAAGEIEYYDAAVARPS